MIRPVKPTDQGYIASTWTRSLCSTHKVPGASSRGHAHQRHIGSQMWNAASERIDAVMDRRDTRGLVFCATQDADTIFGWLVHSEAMGTPIVHYLYVTKAKRGQGIATALLERIGVQRRTAVVCTFLGPDSRMLRSAYPASAHLPVDEFLNPSKEKTA